MTEPRLRHQTKLWLTAISAELHHTFKQEAEGLRTSFDQRVSALESAFSRSNELVEEITQKVHDLAADEAQAAAGHAREQAETAAQSEINALRVQLQAELETARAEFEAARTGLEAQLAETERDITSIRGKRDEQKASLDEARKRIDTLEETNAQTARIRQVTDARLEEEVQRRTTVTTQLEAARQEILLAKAEAESCRLEAHLARERVSVLENQLLQLEAQTRTTTPMNGAGDVVREHIKGTLEELDRARPDEILSMLVGHLRRLYVGVAVFAVSPNGLRLWKSRTGDWTTDNPTQIPSLESESPVALACKQGTTVSATAASLNAGVGLWERPIGSAIALPIVVYGRVMAVAYAENPQGHGDGLTRVLDTIAETLVGCVNRRLNQSPPATAIEPPADLEASAQQETTPSVSTESDQYAVSRQARRVKMNSGVEVLVDGIVAALVDVSALGAQIVSPEAVRPNRVVRIQLPGNGRAVTCEGRIVWSQLESPRANAPAAYRAGVRFANVDPLAITTFISQHVPVETPAAAQA